MPLGLDYGSDELIRYFGFALPGKTGADPAARVGKVTWSGSNTRYRKVQWANADRFTFDQVWNDRALLLYTDNPSIPVECPYVDLTPTPVGGDPTLFDVDCDLSIAQVEVWLDSTPARQVGGTPIGNEWQLLTATRFKLGVSVDILTTNWLWARIWIDSGEL